MKFKLTKETKQHYWITLYRIEALKDFDNISKWDKWWWVEKEENLSQDNTAWVYWNAFVYWNASVSWNARVYWNAWVSWGARVYWDARVYWGFKLQFWRCFARKQKDWDITEIENWDRILLIKDYKPAEKETHTIKLDWKEIELSEASYQEFKKQFE